MPYSFWTVLNLVAFMILLMASCAEGATYNFYFNNTEQEENSRAEPSLVVKGADSPVAPALTAPPLSEAIAAADTTSVSQPEPPTTEAAHRQWRLGAYYTSAQWGRRESTSSTGPYFQNSYYKVSTQEFESTHQSGGASFAATYLPSPYFGLSILWGSFKALESELNLLPSNSPFSFGFLLGFGRSVHESRSSFYWGLQMSLDFADTLGLQIGWRDFGGDQASKASSLGAYLKF